MFQIYFIISLIFLTTTESSYKCEVHDYSNPGLSCSISMQVIDENVQEIEMWEEFDEIKSNVSLAEVKWVEVEMSSLVASPKIFLDSFINVIRVDISDSTGLNELDDVAFFNENLLAISIFKTDLEVIGQNTSQGLSKLLELKLVDNQINTVHKDAFKDLVKLRVLDISFNKIESLDDELFSTNVELESVSFLFNIIKTLSANLFAANINLYRVDFERNKIQKIQKGFAVSLEKLKILDLRSNVCVDNLIEVENNRTVDELLQVCYKNFDEINLV